MTRRKNRNVVVSQSRAAKGTEGPAKNPAAIAKNGRSKKGSSHSASRDGIKVRRPPKFSWVVEGLLAAQGRPTLPGHLQYLCDNNIKYIVTLTKTKPRALLDIPDSLEWVHIPIQDETAPTVAQIQEFVSLIDKAEHEGTETDSTDKPAVHCGIVTQRLAAHCAWGRGRTGTMMACYLAKRQRLSAADAIAEIRRMRPGSVDSAKQENAVHVYVQSLLAKK